MTQQNPPDPYENQPTNIFVWIYAVMPLAFLVVALLIACSPEPEITTVVVTATPEPTYTTQPAKTSKSQIVFESDSFGALKGALKQEAIARGNSELYAEGYAHYLASGGSQEFADSIAVHYEQQRADGKSHEYAISYASIIAQGKSSKYANIFAQAYATEIDAARQQGMSFSEAPKYAEEFASAYAAALTQGRSEEYAKLMAPAYTEQRMAGKSEEYASVYAQIVAIGVSDAVAAPYAEQVVAGKSLEYALMYGTEYARIYRQLSQSLPHEDAAEYASIRADAKADVYVEQLAAGKALDEAEDYANAFSLAYETASLLGKSHEAAIEYARANTEDESSALVTTSQTSHNGNVSPNSALEVSITQMAREYRKNAFRANEMYDNPLSVSAKILEIGGNGVLKLSGGGYNHVEAEIKDKDDLFDLNTGDTARLLCKGAEGSTDSLGAFILFKECAVK